MTETTTVGRTEQHEGLTDRVHDPVHHVSYAFRRQGEGLWVHTWFEDGGHLPEHFHPSIEEYWEAVEGKVRIKLAGTWRDLTPADGRVHVARNVRHELRNESGGEVYLRAEAIPGGGLQEFLTEGARAAREGLYNARNLPTSWRGAVWAADLMHRHRDETVMCFPPPVLQRLLNPPLARLAR